MIKIPLTLILSHRQMDYFMHAADLFESWKVMIQPVQRFEADLKPGQTVALVIPKCIEAINNPVKEYRCIAAFSPGTEAGAWCEHDILMISTGYQWAKFADLLQFEGYLGPMPARYIKELTQPPPPRPLPPMPKPRKPYTKKKP